MKIEKFLLGEVPVTLIKTNKFKTIQLQIRFLGTFTKEMITRRNILCNILQSQSNKYNDDKKVTLKCLELYNSDINITSNITYKTYETIMFTNIIDKKYLPDKKSIKNEVCEFLANFLFDPKINDTSFDEELVSEKIKEQELRIKDLYNNKSTYALYRLYEIMGEGDVLGINTRGFINDLKGINGYNLYQEYLKLLNEDASIYISGDVTKEECLEMLKPFNRLTNKNRKYEMYDTKRYNEQNKKIIIEKRSTNQANLVLGYRSNYNFINDKYYAFSVFCLMYGGIFSSSLFQEIREKNSLCYNISSYYLSDLKVMTVQCGIDEDNFDITLKLIENIFANYQKGLIDDNLLETTKKELISYYDQIEDKHSTMINQMAKYDRFDKVLSPIEIKKAIEKVTKEDIIEVCNNTYLYTVYLLKNGEDNEN